MGKEFVARLGFTWRTMFDSKYLLLTNTLTGGALLALGDCAQQNWEKHKDPNRAYDWMRTGEREERWRLFVQCGKSFCSLRGAGELRTTEENLCCA